MKIHSKLPWRRSPYTLIVALLFGILLGCSGGSGGSSSSVSRPEVPEPRLLVSELSFASSNLQDCVDSLATREDWQYANEIAYINCDFYGSNKSLQGMEVFADMPQSSLVELWFHGAIDDLRPIAGLTTVRELNLFDYKLLDLSPLTTLTQLEYLRLRTEDGCPPEMNCDLRDLTLLAELKNLKQLMLNDRNSDLLSQISLLSNLEYLELKRMKLSNLSWAESLTKLEVLDISQTSNAKDYDIDAVIFLENLRELALPSGNPKNDTLQPLASLKKLKKLSLCDITLNDLSPLAELVEMEQLGIVPCKHQGLQGSIVDISALSELENLRVLSIRHQLIEDMSPLENLKKLENLSLGYNRISYGTEVLAGMSKLNYLFLNNNNISYVPPLDPLVQLLGLVLDNNQIQNLQPLLGLEDLELLDIGDNGLSDISLLASMSNVDTLDLGKNNISDLSPVREMSGLRLLRIEASATNCEQINELRDAQIIGLHIEKGWRC